MNNCFENTHVGLKWTFLVRGKSIVFVYSSLPLSRFPKSCVECVDFFKTQCCSTNQNFGLQSSFWFFLHTLHTVGLQVKSILRSMAATPSKMRQAPTNFTKSGRLMLVKLLISINNKPTVLRPIENSRGRLKYVGGPKG